MRRLLAAGILIAGCAAAQNVQTMRASIRGNSSDNGKCTIEVEVDGAADVEVRGDTGWIRTLQGQPSRWRRFECNAPIPRNPVDFRFRGIDGRGDVQLIRDPNSAGGAAVVRINDSDGGREGYTFDLEWRGAGGAYSSNDPYYGDRRRNRNDPYRNDPGYRNNRPYSSDGYGNNNAWGYGNFSQQSVAACEDAVRVQARRQQGVRNIRFLGANVEDMRGNRDRVIGTFEGNRGEQYVYSCRVQENNGRIRDVDIRRR